MTAKRFLTHSALFRALALIVLFGVATAVPSRAQADQEYKKSYNSALEAAKAKKYDDAYGLFTKAADQAKKAGDTEIANKANKVVAQLDYMRGKKLSDASKFDEALTHFEKGIKRYPQYSQNYLGQGLALAKLGREDEALAVYQNAMKSTDAQIANAAKDAVRQNYIYLASTALTRNGGGTTRADAQEAIKDLTDMQKYVEADADTYYYLGEAYKVLNDYNKVVDSANKALALHKGSKSDKAKIYFLKGEAHMSLGDNASAKAAFSEARFGSYKASAEHYLSTL